MSTIIGGVTVADPVVPARKMQLFNGAYSAAIDGTTLMDGTGTKTKWSLEWQQLTQTQYDALIAKLTVTGSQTFSPPEESGTYTVLVRQDTLTTEATTDGSGTMYFNVKADLQEV